MEGLLSVQVQAGRTLSGVAQACIAAMTAATDGKKVLLFGKKKQKLPP
jgi:hypothetical protein